MKRIYLLSFFIILASFAYAKVLTVNNSPGSTAQYATIAAAMTAATAGDTIYVQGSETAYVSFNLDKKLVFIGPGHNPQKQFPLKATLTNITMGTTSLATGSTFIGLNINNISTTGTFTINNITIKRCYIGSITVYNGSGGETTNWVIEGNIIINNLSAPSNSAAASNFMITNNVIPGIIYYANGCFISNNIFVAGISSNSTAFSSIKNSTIQNNIFYGVSPEGAENSTFSNNITYSTKSNPLPYGTNVGAANKVDVNPAFVNFPEAGDNSFKYDYDFHLQTSSPGKNAGTDLKDLGIYGGVGFSESGEPGVPQIREFLIKNGIVAPGSKLNITIKAEAKN